MDDAEALAQGRALLSVIRGAYAAAREEHDGDTPFPTQAEWIKLERTGRLADLRFVEDADGWRYDLASPASA